MGEGGDLHLAASGQGEALSEETRRPGMTQTLRRRVRARAGDRCEYCRLKQEHEPDRPFHVEHVIARSHRGGDAPSNLALACQLCNLLKGPNLSSIDPDTEKLERLFHPRK